MTHHPLICSDRQRPICGGCISFMDRFEAPRVPRLRCPAPRFEVMRQGAAYQADTKE